MSTRSAKSSGVSPAGEMNGRRFSEEIGVAHGTVKRWLHEGMPARREGTLVWIDLAQARDWIAKRFKGRTTVAFNRSGSVYAARRLTDGAIKIGWTSDIMRRMFELRKRFRCEIELLACVPGGKPDELRIHKHFASSCLGEEWFSAPANEVLAALTARSAA